MGKRVVHCGDAGAGQAAKICNNMMLGISMIGVCEAFVLAEKLGLSHQALFDVASTSSGQCWSLTSYCPVPGPVPTAPSNNDYKPGFASALMLKDLKLAQEAAAAPAPRRRSVPRPRRCSACTTPGARGGTDFSGIIHLIRGKQGMSPRPSQKPERRGGYPGSGRQRRSPPRRSRLFACACSARAPRPG